jgi:peptide-methionine (R)-S-oxide reductase
MLLGRAMNLVLLVRTAAFTPIAAKGPARVLAVGGRRAFARMVDNDQDVEYSVKKSDAAWKEELSPERYYVLREKGTERPGTGEYNKFYPKEGHFVCGGCGQPLYSAQAKFDSGCGWPAFDRIVDGAVVTQTDTSLGMRRVEIMCGGCGGHLGHVFEGEGFTETMERHCVNSLSVKYVDAPLPDGSTEGKVMPPFEKRPNPASDLLKSLFGDEAKGK